MNGPVTPERSPSRYRTDLPEQRSSQGQKFTLLPTEWRSAQRAATKTNEPSDLEPPSAGGR